MCILSKSAAGLLVSGVVFLVAWLGSFIIYGFGELVECTQENAYYLNEIYRNMIKNCNQNTGTGEQLHVQLEEDKWKCVKCGKLNKKEAMACTCCGKRRF